MLLSTVVLTLAGHTGLFAIQAPPHSVTVTQPDGTQLELMPYGNERLHYVTDLQGFPMERDANGYYRYVADDGTTTKLRKSINSTVDAKTVTSRYLNRLRQNRSERIAPAIKSTTKGSVRVPVILVEFQDVDMTIGTTTLFNEMQNKEGYNYNRATGSCRDYFVENSNSQYQPQFDILGPVKLSKERSYYGSNDTSGNEPNLGVLIKEACEALDSTVDFSIYDNDGDGVMDFVYVYYAGKGEHDTQKSEYIWPCSSYMDWTETKSFVLDNVTINKFAISNELQASGTFTGIGTFVHEFTHVLGLPDLYATSSTSQDYTPGAWSVLGSGNYNNDSRTPPYLSAYERYALGWLQPEELITPKDATLESIAGNNGYIINTGNTNEYFILENRQNTGWDKYLPGHGMLIWHIDYDETAWSRNVVNNTNKHQRVDIEEADNTHTDTDRTGYTFPGTSKNTSFTDTTTPSMLCWDGTAMDKPITDIAESSGVITFKFRGGKRNLYAPTDVHAEDVTPIAMTVAWTPCTDCDSQTIRVYTKDTEGSAIPVEGYAEKVLDTATSSETLTGLTPSTTYYVQVKSDTRYESSDWSTETAITTLDPTFDMLAMVAHQASNVADSSFTANWEALDGAESYTLSVVSRFVDTNEYEDVCSFTGKTPADGWTASASSYFSANGYYGEAAPAISVAADGHYIESPLYGEVKSLSFWSRSMSYSSMSSLIIEGFDGSSWGTLATKAMNPTTTAGETFSIGQNDGTMPAGIKAIRLRLSSEGEKAGRLLIDDIKVGYLKSDTDTPLAGYTDLNVGNVTSYTVSGLTKGRLYVYTLQGIKGELKSLVSNEIYVTPGSGAVEAIDSNGIRVHCVCGMLTVSADANSQVFVYNAAGLLIKHFQTGNDGIRQTAIDKGIYLVKVGDKIFKVVSR